MTTTTTRPAVGVGTEFRSPLADSNPLWRVTRKVRPGVYEAVVQDEPVEVGGHVYPSDWAGTRQLFTVEAIRAVLVQLERIAELRRADDAFWQAQELGAVVHYCDGFGKYVRGVVVDDDGHRKMRPTALVGRWEPRDLWRRSDPPFGPFDAPAYHVSKVLHGVVWAPSTTCVWEAPRCAEQYHRQGDPRTMDPVDLSPPVS